MSHTAPIGIFCRIKTAGFSGERIAQLDLPGGEVRRVLVPLHYCWKRNGSPLPADQPSSSDAIDGIIAARRLGDRGGDGIVVTTPDGEVFLVPRDLVTSRPEPELSTNVSI